MPNYDKLVEQLSLEDAEALFKESGVSDHPRAQLILRKLKGAHARKSPAPAEEKPVEPPLKASVEKTSEDVTNYKLENEALSQLVVLLKDELVAARAPRETPIYEHTIERDDKGLIVRVISHPKKA